MFSTGLSVLVQAQIDDLLDGLNATGFAPGTRRKKAIERFSNASR